MTNRVIHRKGARELTAEEVRQVSAGATTFHLTGTKPHILDVIPD